MVDMRQKKLRYRRATFDSGAPTDHTLEKSILAAFAVKKNIPSRRVRLADGHVIDCLRFSKRSVGRFIHLAVYTPGEEASVVPVLGASAAEGDVSVVDPPVNHDFMDGDLMMLVDGNNVLICASGVHDAKIVSYFVSLFGPLDLKDFEKRFSIDLVADVNNISLIQSEGVKEIALSSTLYEASVEKVRRESRREQLTGAVVDELLAIFRKDRTLKEIVDRENITAEVILKFDRRRKGGEVGSKRLSALAKDVLDESEGGFKITTLAGNTISGSELSLSKKVNLASHGKSVQWSAAAKALDEYRLDLKVGGHLDD